MSRKHSGMAPSFVSPVLPMRDIVLTTVQPLHKTPHPETIDPTFMDSLLSDCYVRVFFAYRLDNNSKRVYCQAAKRIKESLQKVLIPFFSFAGRWVDEPKGSTGRKLLCTDEGVPFIEAHADRDLDSVVHASTAFQPVSELQGLEVLGMDPTKTKQQMQPDGLPPIFVQMTQFKCGGLVLGVNFNHIHTDGKGFFDFMTAWSDISRTNVTAVEVDHDRAQLDLPAELIAPLATSIAAINKTSSSEEGGAGGMAPTVPTPFIMKAFEVEASVIKALKQEAKRMGEGAGYVSTGDCIVAHMWRSFARLPPTLLGDKGLAVGLAVDGRARFYDSPVPFVCGNAVLGMLAPEIAVEEVRAMPLVSLASRIRNKLQIAERESWFDLETMVKVRKAYKGSSVAFLNVTSWFSFPMYELDFGFGKPFLASGPNKLNQSSSPPMAAIYIGPPIPSRVSSIAIVYLKCTREVMEALEQNPDFSAFFSGDSEG